MLLLLQRGTACIYVCVVAVFGVNEPADIYICVDDNIVHFLPA